MCWLAFLSMTCGVRGDWGCWSAPSDRPIGFIGRSDERAETPLAPHTGSFPQTDTTGDLCF